MTNNPTAMRGLAHRIRIHALRMTNIGGGSHIGAIFSARTSSPCSTVAY